MKLWEKIRDAFQRRRRAEKKSNSGVSVIVPPNKAKDARDLEGTKLADCPLLGVCTGLA